MASAPAPSPRAWIGQATYPWPSFRAVPDGDVLRACYYVVEYKADTTRTGQPYLRLRLADRHGLLEGMVWEEVEASAPHVVQGGFVGVQGRVGSYNGRKQIRIDRLVSLRVRAEEAEHFLPAGDRDPEVMEAELATLVGSIRDEGLRGVVETVLDPSGETGRLFRRAPAAKRNHHAYVTGLIEHTLSVASACDRLAEHYGGEIDRDLLIAGALLHDIGKTREIALAPGFPYTDEGRLLGHIVMGLSDVESAARGEARLEPGRRTLLLHLIASHQGRYEWQSPREPMTLEAVLLHYADDLDAKLAQVRGRLADVPDGGWSAYDRSFGREFLRHGESTVGEAGAEGRAPEPGGDAPESGGRAAEPGRRVPDPDRSAPAPGRRPAERPASGGAEPAAPDPELPDPPAATERPDPPDAPSAPSLFDRLL
jgi:3'-5' exoribonuclease